MLRRPLSGCVVCAALMLTACSQPVADGSAPSDLAGVCAALSAAERGDRAGAEREFLGQAHEALHDLASDLDGADRRDLAARLLETKNRVESDLATDTASDQDLATRISDVLTVVRDARSALDRPVPDCADLPR